MKDYNKPTINEELIELEDIINGSNIGDRGDGYINDEEGDDIAG